MDIHLTYMLSRDVIFSSEKQLDKESQVERYTTMFENQLFEIVNNKVSNFMVKYHFDDNFSKEHHQVRQHKYPKTISSSQNEDSDIISQNPTKKRKLSEEGGLDSGNGKLDFPDMEVMYLMGEYLFSSEHHRYYPFRGYPYEDDQSDDKSDNEYDDESEEEF